MRIAVGISGGVDSSVAALLLKQQGHQVFGLFMKNWEEDDRDGYCGAAEDLEDARRVCERLDIPLHTVNFSADYWDRVFEHFLAEYRAGRTPNPDVLCNREIKFKSFLEHARDLGADKIATGHYARIRETAEGFQLLAARDANKDQSYFLHLLDQPQLAASCFPLGDLEKSRVRELARRAGLSTSEKKDSTGICFIGERNFRDFLQHYLPARPGEMVTPEGEVMGQHQGLMYYTLGQRGGLGLGGSRRGDGRPWYVVDKDLTRNRLIVAQGHDHPLLYHQALETGQVHWISGRPPSLPLSCEARVRYRQPTQVCEIESSTPEGHCRVRFSQPQWAVTPGQSVVFYQGETCLGGAVIDGGKTL